MTTPAHEMIRFLSEHVTALSERELWEGVEAIQAYRDELRELIDDLPESDLRVIIRIDKQGPLLRLKNAAEMAKHITELGHE